MRIFRAQELHRSAAERFDLFPQGHHSAHPPEQRMAIAFMRFNVGALVVVLRVDDHGQDQTLRISRRKSCVAIRAPLHWSTYSVAIAKIDVVSHSDFIAIVNHWRS